MNITDVITEDMSVMDGCRAAAHDGGRTNG